MPNSERFPTLHRVRKHAPRRATRRSLFIASTLFALASGTSALAQSASQITPDSFAPITRQPSGAITVPQAMPSAAPEGADSLFVTLGGLAIEGEQPEAEVVAALRSSLVGERTSVADIFAQARWLETVYADRGEVLTRVLVPAQDLARGAVLRLIIVRGEIEAVDTSAVPGAMAGKVDALLSSLVGRPGVTIGEIERKLMLAADLPGLTLQTTLLPGRAPGSSVLAVEGDYRPIDGLVGIDNRLPDGLGRESVSVGANFNGMLGWGETLYLRASGDPSTGFFGRDPRNRSLAAGVVLPVGNNGLSLNVEATDARTGPDAASGFPEIGTRFQRLATRITYPFLLDRSLRLSGTAVFDVTDEDIDIMAPIVLPVSRDRMRVVRLSGALAAYLPGNGQLTSSVELAQGLNIFGARTASDASAALPLSRAGADAEFTALRWSGGIDQPLLSHLAFRLDASAQTTFGDAVVNSETFGLSSSDGVSPLAQGRLQGDDGFVSRLEVSTPFTFRSASAVMSPYGFAAAGWATRHQPTAAEQREIDAEGYGLGVRLAGNRPRPLGWSLGAELGWGTASGLPTTDRFSLTAQIRF